MAARVAASLLLLASPVAVTAQEAGDEAADDAAAMKALETAVPKQSWYPDGYYDVRIAAEAEVAEAIPSSPPGPGEEFNLMACHVQKPMFGADDPLLVSYGGIALETARLRSELGRRHFPEALYAAPLAAFERERIVAVLPKGEVYAALADALNARDGTSSPGRPPVVAFDDCPRPPSPPPPPPPPPDAADPFELGKPGKSASNVTSPRKPATVVKSTPNVTASPKPAAAIPRRAPGVTFTTQPPAGEVLMINAFAFKVCVRKNPDPWDRFQCKWNEIETGVARPLSGRFVYQVRWPDGTVRKGTREIAPADTGAVTFKKVGS